MSNAESKDKSEGMDEADLKIPSQSSPAFLSRSSREDDKAGSEDMCEHCTNFRAVRMTAERHLVVIISKQAEFCKTE